ncbi:transposable element Tcb1 transposase [Trichonephila clavipes]|nr:transposable element Tcb1 transposase [Trichonephila clavipes]
MGIETILIRGPINTGCASDTLSPYLSRVSAYLRKKIPYLSRDDVDSLLCSNEKFPSYKSDDISMNGESKADQLENYDTKVERLPDWLRESFQTSSEVLRKKTLEEFSPFSDNISKRFASRNSRDSPDETFDESLSSSENNLLSSDEDKENEPLTRSNRQDLMDDYVLDSQSTTSVIAWTETLLLKQKEEALRNENSKLHAKLEGISQRNKKLQHELKKLKSFVSEIQQVFVRTFRRRLQQHGLYSETMASATLEAASQTGTSSKHENSLIRVWRYRGKRTLAACIRHQHTGPSPSVMQDNTRPYVASIVRTFFDTKHFWLLPWPARSPDLLPIENIWSMVAERLARHHMSVTTVDELWHRVEAASTSVPVHVIQSLFDSMARRIGSVITATRGYYGY